MSLSCLLCLRHSGTVTILVRLLHTPALGGASGLESLRCVFCMSDSIQRLAMIHSLPPHHPRLPYAILCLFCASCHFIRTYQSIVSSRAFDILPSFWCLVVPSLGGSGALSAGSLFHCQTLHLHNESSVHPHLPLTQLVMRLFTPSQSGFRTGRAKIILLPGRRSRMASPHSLKACLRRAMQLCESCSKRRYS